MQLLHSFSRDRSIVVSKPDWVEEWLLLTGIGMISMNDIISDPYLFPLITECIHKFLLCIEHQINNFLRKVIMQNYITNEVYSALFVSGSGPGILYRLPKIHKSDFFTRFQFRPIFASYSTPSFNLAIFLVPILNPFTCNEYTTVNTYSFINEITSVQSASNYYMVSFDVENLFTNVPLYENW